LTTVVASALAAVPVAVVNEVSGSPLATAIATATATLAVDPQISQDQVVLAAEDVVVDGDVLGQSITAATSSGNEGVGEKDGLASLDDLLAYTGPMTEDRTAMMPTDLLFEYNSSELKETARLSLMKLGFIIQKNPEAEISLEGHSDTFGGEAYNLTLSEARANAVKNWLVESLRLEAARLNTRGWGKAKLLVPDGDVAAQQKNRRVEIVIRPKK
jgi:outer membrane protein OmpA-like peptidoglycan-associated protein